MGFYTLKRNIRLRGSTQLVRYSANTDIHWVSGLGGDVYRGGVREIERSPTQAVTLHVPGPRKVGRLPVHGITPLDNTLLLIFTIEVE